MDMRSKMQMRPRVSRAKRFAAAAIIALGMASALAGARPALAGVATGETAFNNGDFMTAVREFQGPAYGGDAVAQYYMGVIYAGGLGVSQSLEEGLGWLICAQTVELPSPLGQKAKRQQSAILSRITPYALEQAEMRAEFICNRAVATNREAFSNNERDPEEIRPARGFSGGLFFFPGDSMVTGAAVVFDLLGLTLMGNFLLGIARMFGDFLFGLLALIGWFVIGRFVLIFVTPVWKMMLDRAPSTQDDSTGGSSQPPAQDAEPD